MTSDGWCGLSRRPRIVAHSAPVPSLPYRRCASFPNLCHDAQPFSCVFFIPRIQVTLLKKSKRGGGGGGVDFKPLQQSSAAAASCCTSRKPARPRWPRARTRPSTLLLLRSMTRRWRRWTRVLVRMTFWATRLAVVIFSTQSQLVLFLLLLLVV